MNTTELTKAAAKEAGVTNAVAAAVIRGLFGDKENAGVLATALSEGDRVQITNFGSFVPKTRPARVGRNPSTGGEVQIPEKTAIQFKPASGLKGFLNGE